MKEYRFCPRCRAELETRTREDGVVLVRSRGAPPTDAPPT